MVTSILDFNHKIGNVTGGFTYIAGCSKEHNNTVTFGENEGNREKKKNPQRRKQGKRKRRDKPH
jgi:hypothetical protein